MLRRGATPWSRSCAAREIASRTEPTSWSCSLLKYIFTLSRYACSAAWCSSCCACSVAKTCETLVDLRYFLLVTCSAAANALLQSNAKLLCRPHGSYWALPNKKLTCVQHICAYMCMPSSHLSATYLYLPYIYQHFCLPAFDV